MHVITILLQPNFSPKLFEHLTPTLFEFGFLFSSINWRWSKIQVQTVTKQLYMITWLQFIRKIRILNLRSSSIVQGELKSKPFGVTWLIISTRNLSGPQLKWHAYVSSGYLFLIPHWTKNRTVAYISRLDHCGAVIHVTNYILRIRLYHFDIIFIMIIHKNNVFIPC